MRRSVVEYIYGSSSSCGLRSHTDHKYFSSYVPLSKASVLAARPKSLESCATVISKMDHSLATSGDRGWNLNRKIAKRTYRWS